MDKEALIQSALNHYWNDAHDQLTNGGALSLNGERRPLGDIEKEQLESRLGMCKQLMDEIDEIQPTEGFKTYRHTQNPKEKELHDKFIEWYLSPGTGNFDLLVFPPEDTHQTYAVDTLTQREIRIVITMVQWMGTPLGQSLLSECGFEPVEKKTEWVVLKEPKGWKFLKTPYIMQGFVYLEDDEPTLCSSTLKWLDKVEVTAKNRKTAEKLAWEYFNNEYPEYKNFIQLY